MTNVKPGDLARVVADPNQQNALGLQVFVVEQAKINCQTRLDMAMKFNCPVWECQLLETRMVREEGKPKLMHAGKLYAIVDVVLKRIDPPADTQDLLAQDYLPGELGRIMAALINKEFSDAP